MNATCSLWGLWGLSVARPYLSRIWTAFTQRWRFTCYTTLWSQRSSSFSLQPRRFSISNSLRLGGSTKGASVTTRCPILLSPLTTLSHTYERSHLNNIWVLLVYHLARTWVSSTYTDHTHNSSGINDEKEIIETEYFVWSLLARQDWGDAKAERKSRETDRSTINEARQPGHQCGLELRKRFWNNCQGDASTIEANESSQFCGVVTRAQSSHAQLTREWQLPQILLVAARHSTVDRRKREQWRLFYRNVNRRLSENREHWMQSENSIDSSKKVSKREGSKYKGIRQRQKKMIQARLSCRRGKIS